MTPRIRRRVLLCLSLALGMVSSVASAGNPKNPILFVTQVPMPEEVNSRTVTESYQSCVSPFSNHLAGTAHAGRGGSLHVRFGDGKVFDLLALADWSAIPGGKPAANKVAVRSPSVAWTADRAIFSMVVGAPNGPNDATQFLWQLYEITLPTEAQLQANVKPVLTLVDNQPAYNNISPVYALNGRIVFVSDRPYDGQAHLLQREEYLGLPTVTGLWTLDPLDASSLSLMHHAPSGAFSPKVDAVGRVIFSSWDHLARDPQAVTDSRTGIVAQPYAETFTQTFNGAGNFVDETKMAAFTKVTAMPPNSWDIFPEPRNFDKKSLIDDFGGNLNGNSQNIFLPWMINVDGTRGETLNHVGRHEVAGPMTRSFKNDVNIVDLNPAVNPGYGGMGVRTFFNNFLAPAEDPLQPGSFYGADAPDLGTHGAGQIVRLNKAGAGVDLTPQNPDGITVTYITPGAGGTAKPGFIPTVKPSINLPPTGQVALAPNKAETLYRTPLPLADGNLVASMAANVTQTDYNSGTVAQPATFFSFRLTSLKPSGPVFVPDVMLTPGLAISTSYYVGATLVSYNGPAWELDPVEVVSRTPPKPPAPAVDPIEASVFAEVGVHIPTFQAYLRSIGAALTISRDVTKRDYHDRQQPFNLRVKWSGWKTTGTPGTIYDVAWIQFLQADLRRGYTLGGQTPAPGRRVVATPLHDTMAENVQTPGAPPGALKLGDDGSFAAILPAGKAMTWHLQDDDVAKTSQVKERFWVTFQPGEIRTCANCHGINTSDQSGTLNNPVGPPMNQPAALFDLLEQWKADHPAGTVEYAAAVASAFADAGSVSIDVVRTGGSTGPASVQFTTVDGSALAGVDYTQTDTMVNWADGDMAVKTVDVPLLGNVMTGDKTFTAVLSGPQYADLGTITIVDVTIKDPSGGGSGGSSAGGSSGGATDGGTSTTGGTGGTGEPVTTGASGQPTGGDPTAGAGSSGSGGEETDSASSGGGEDGQEGCACRANPTGAAGDMIALLLGGIAAGRRRRRAE